GAELLEHPEAHVQVVQERNVEPALDRALVDDDVLEPIEEWLRENVIEDVDFRGHAVSMVLPTAAAPRPRLKTALVRRGHTQPLMDGTIALRGVEFEVEDVPNIITAFRRMVRGLEFDVSEMAMTTYLCARAHGKPFTAIPVFPMRAFHHGAIVYNTTAGIRTPKDLEGRKVGINRGYTVTTGLWARSILQHEHGVDL